MKTTYILSVIVFGLLFASCAPLKYSEEVYSMDFRKYSEQGFVITPTDNINREYVSLLNVEMVFTSGFTDSEEKFVERRGFSQSEIKDDLYRDRNTLRVKKTQEDNWFMPTYEYMLDQFVQYAKSMGADAIVDFKMIVNGDRVNGVLVNKKWHPVNVILSGFAIKILD